MTGHIYHPERKHPGELQKDLGPQASQGTNYGTVGVPERRSVHDVKSLHQQLQDFTDDELRQMRVLCEGARLETGAVYLNLALPRRVEMKASGTEVAGPDDYYLAKSDTPFEFWNRLLGIEQPERVKRR